MGFILNEMGDHGTALSKGAAHVVTPKEKSEDDCPPACGAGQ